MKVLIHSRQFRVHALLLAMFLVLTVVLAVVSFIISDPASLPSNRVISITADIFGMCLGLVLYLCCGSDTQWDEENLKAFLMLIGTCFVAAFADEYAWLVDGKDYLRIPNLITNTVYYGTTPLMAYSFWRYVVTFLNTRKERVDKWNKIFLTGLVVTVLSIVGNAWFGYYFFVDEAGNYQRAELFSIPLIYAYLMLGMTLLLVIIARKRFQRFQIIALFSYAVVPMAMGLVTVLTYGISLSSAVIMMVLMLMYCVLNVVQSREQNVAENELHLASAIQEAMLPRKFPPYPDRKEFDIHALMDPAKEVGGDFYDFFLVDDDHLAMVIADVSGKGIPASLFMMVSKTLIKTQTIAKMDMDPSEILERVNTQICENNNLEMFVTVWLGILTISSGKLVYANAGHEYPALKHKGEAFALRKEKHSPPLGAIEGIPFRKGEVTLQKGDILYVYTDGVPEASDIEQHLLGTEQMVKILNQSDTEDPSKIDAFVRGKIDEFANGAAQFDDITMLCLRYDGPQELAGKEPEMEAKMKTEEISKDAETTGGEELTVEAEAGNLPKVQSFIEQYLEAADCPPKEMMQIGVAVEEIFVNIASYAYAPDTGEATVRVRVEQDPKCAVVTFLDQGKPYDPLSREDPDVSLAAEDREIGGLGIFITKKTMDEVSYEYKDGKNVFTMKKKF